MERCYMEGVTYLGRCRRCREKQFGEGVLENDVVDEVYIGDNPLSLSLSCAAPKGID